MTSPLTPLNYLNVAAYVLNAAVVFGIDYTPLPSNPEVSARFPTLVTPAGFAFAIWSIIFISQATFAIIQVLPSYRNTALVQKGVSYFYIGACISQATWAILFAFQQIWLSAIAMVAILFFLMQIVMAQNRIRTKDDEDYEPVNKSILDFWLLIFPFSIHAGWIVVASLVNISLVLVRYNASATVQFYTAIASVVVLVVVAVMSLKGKEPNFVAPLVFAWALFAIYSELKAPPELITKTFDAGPINTVKNASLVVCVMFLVAVAVRAVLVITGRPRPNSEQSERLI